MVWLIMDHPTVANTLVSVIGSIGLHEKIKFRGITTLILKLSNIFYGLNNIYHPWLSQSV